MTRKRRTGVAKLTSLTTACFPCKRVKDRVFNPMFNSWVSEDLVIAESSPTHRRVSSTLGVSDGGPLPGSSAIGSTEAPRHFEHAGSADDGLHSQFRRPLRYSNWRRRIWLPSAKAGGCEGAGFHDLRRLNATTLVVGGVDVKTAQVRLGHADPRMTLSIYASAPVTADRAAAETVDQRFFGDTP